MRNWAKTMDYAKASLRLHREWGGKIEVVCTVPCKAKAVARI